MMITSEGVIIRIPASGISTIGRSTKGVRLMRLKDGVKVVSIGITEHEEPEEETENPENPAEETVQTPEVSAE